MNLKNATTNLSLFFIKNARITISIILLFLIVGGLSYSTWLKREGFPSVDVPIVTVKATYAVNDAGVVDREVTSIIEESLLEIEGLESLSSSTNPNGAVLSADFSEGVSAEEGKERIDESLKAASLNENIEYEIVTIDSEKVDGVHDLLFTINGEFEREELENKAESIALKLEESSEITQADALKSSVEQTNPTTGVTSTVQESFTRIGYKDGENNLVFADAATIGIIGDPTLDSIELSNAVKNKMQALEEEGELDGLTVRYGGDPAEGLSDSIASLEGNAISGILAVVLVVFLLVTWRSSVVISIFIPLVLGGTFLSLFALGYSLNIISLFGLILVLGLFVDDAIVIVEAVDSARRKGKKGLAAIKTAIDSVGVADISGTLTTILVFLPMLFISGILGDFIELIPITVMISLIISLFVALAILPLISALIMKEQKNKTKTAHTINSLAILTVIIFGYGFFSNQENPLLFIAVTLLLVAVVIAAVSFGKTLIHKKAKVSNEPRLLNAAADVLNFPGKLLDTLSRYQGSLINYLLSNKKITVLSTISVVIASTLLIGLSIFAASKLTFTVFPLAKDSNAIEIDIETTQGTSIQKAKEIAVQAETIIEQKLGDDFVELNYLNADKDEISFVVGLTDLGERSTTSAEYSEILNTEFESQIEGATLRAVQESPGPKPQEYPFAVQIFDDDSSELEAAAKNIEQHLLQLQLNDGTNIEAVKLGNFSTLQKKDGRLYTEVRAKTDGEASTAQIVEIQESLTTEYSNEKLASLGLRDTALEFDLGTESDNLESFNSAIYAFVIALALMYVLLMLQFNSFSQPLLIFMALPLSFPGLFPGLLLTDNPISFFTLLGMTGLAGIVVNNSIMLLEFANQAKQNGANKAKAISQAVESRFRPIIVTSTTTILGLYPLAVSDPFWEPLALSIIFGVIASALLITVIFPFYYVIIEGIRDLKSKIIKINLS
jgi:multidrug efflux pump subunit AcrB